MIKYKDFKQYKIQPDQSFFPNPNKSQSVPWDGENLKSQLHLSPPRTNPNRPREEDSIGVLTMPPKPI